MAFNEGTNVIKDVMNLGTCLCFRSCSDLTVPYRFETVFVTVRSLFTLVSERFGARNGAVVPIKI